MRYNLSMGTLQEVRKEIKAHENKDKAMILLRFFKTAKGQYGEGDLFLGLTVPQSRKIARKYKDLSLFDVKELIKSDYHEERLIALLILILQFVKGEGNTKKKIYSFYLSHTKYINNWDLVDVSADKIIGGYLYFQCHLEPALARNTCDIGILKKLALSTNLWEKRIAMVATFQFLKACDPTPTKEIAAVLLYDKHDLIQKAVGWMLREMGKRCGEEELVEFLSNQYKTMPRTALRYSIEHFPPDTRKKYLLGEV